MGPTENRRLAYGRKAAWCMVQGPHRTKVVPPSSRAGSSWQGLHNAANVSVGDFPRRCGQQPSAGQACSHYRLGTPRVDCQSVSPHTTTSKGRLCHECHGNPKAAGLGEGLMGIEKPGFSSVWRPESQVPGRSFLWDALVDQKGNALQWSSHPSAGPLDAPSVMRLLNPSGRHRAEWHRYLSGEGRSGP